MEQSRPFISERFVHGNIINRESEPHAPNESLPGVCSSVRYSGRSTQQHCALLHLGERWSGSHSDLEHGRWLSSQPCSG